MSDVKWDTFPTKATTVFGDRVVGLSVDNTNVIYPVNVFNFTEGVTAGTYAQANLTVPVTLAASGMVNKSYTLQPSGADQNLTFPTAKSIYDYLVTFKGSALSVGTSFTMRLTNISGFDVYLVAGTGMTFDGLVSDSIHTGTCVDLRFVFTNVSDPTNPTLYVTGGQLDPSSGQSPTIVTGTSQTIAMGTTYIANSATLLTFTLPATAIIGESFKIIGQGLGKYKIAQNADDQIKFLDKATTIGTGGSLTAPDRYATIEIICIAIDTFSVTYSSGVDWDVI